jgi:hypothetical protein
MWDAWTDGRMDDVVATMQPDVTWKPLTRPARSFYRGHAGIRRMREDVARVHGTFHTEMSDLDLLSNGSVACQGVLTVHEEAEPSTLRFEALCLMRDGLIAVVDSYAPADPLPA